MRWGCEIIENGLSEDTHEDRRFLLSAQPLYSLSKTFPDILYLLFSFGRVFDSLPDRVVALGEGKTLWPIRNSLARRARKPILTIQ